MDKKTLIPLLVTIILAFVGYIVKYINDIAMARRKDRLDRINQQLRNLYGPLYATDRALNIAWDAFRSRYRPHQSFFRSQPPPSHEDLAAWRLWMSEVFMPLNLRMERIIVENADLMLEDEMPECFSLLSAHIAAYKPVLKRWQLGDNSEHNSFSAYPTNLRDYIETSYRQLKKKQALLLGHKDRQEGIERKRRDTTESDTDTPGFYVRSRAEYERQAKKHSGGGKT